MATRLEFKCSSSPSPPLLTWCRPRHLSLTWQAEVGSRNTTASTKDQESEVSSIHTGHHPLCYPLLCQGPRQFLHLGRHESFLELEMGVGLTHTHRRVGLPARVLGESVRWNRWASWFRDSASWSRHTPSTHLTLLV